MALWCPKGLLLCEECLVGRSGSHARVCGGVRACGDGGLCFMWPLEDHCGLPCLRCSGGWACMHLNNWVGAIILASAASSVTISMSYGWVPRKSRRQGKECKHVCADMCSGEKGLGPMLHWHVLARDQQAHRKYSCPCRGHQQATRRAQKCKFSRLVEAMLTCGDMLGA